MTSTCQTGPSTLPGQTATRASPAIRSSLQPRQIEQLASSQMKKTPIVTKCPALPLEWLSFVSSSMLLSVALLKKLV
ncbi:hypothetical protein QVD99_008466 [Batrachochytrium dendrobatidis]|nr:hypothetical protein QVD99_008466 [Batrachochytrium dendrobatidis]